MNVAAGDDRSWPEMHRRRRTVLVVDMADSVRLMQENEDDVIDRWRRFVRDVREEVLPRHDGRLVKSLGDGMLIEFEQTPRAVAAAFALHRHVGEYNNNLAEGRCIRLRMGVHVDDVVADDIDIYGSGVNLAARIASMARPGGLTASQFAIDELLPGVDSTMQDGGGCFFKHLSDPIQVYHLEPAEGEHGARASLERQDAHAFHRMRDEAALSTCVALVPLTYTRGDRVQKTLADLTSDILLTRLSTVPQLRVISRLSTEQFRLRGLDVRAVAELTAASYLIGGRLHGAGQQTAIYLELIDPSGQTILWASTVRLNAVDLLSPDETVTAQIAQDLVDHIVAHQLRKVSTTPLPNLASQTLQFSAIHLMHRRSRPDFERSKEILEHLVDRHPAAPPPHAWLAKWHVLRVTKGWASPTHAEGERALTHTRRALDLNSDSAMTLAMEAFVYCHMKRDLSLARQRLEEAMEVNSNEPWVWLVRATVESLLDHGETSWQCASRARSLSPMDPLKHYFDGLSASAAVSAQRFDEAVRLARLSLVKDGGHLPTLRALAIAQVHLGEIGAARETVSSVLKLQPDFTLTRYVSDAPHGAEEVRRRWSKALREAGAPA